MRTAYGWLWLGWIAWFAACEFTALATGHPEDTLSEFTWRAEALGQPWTFARYLVAAFCLWLAGHLVFGWWRLGRPAFTISLSAATAHHQHRDPQREHDGTTPSSRKTGRKEHSARLNAPAQARN